MCLGLAFGAWWGRRNFERAASIQNYCSHRCTIGGVCNDVATRVYVVVISVWVCVGVIDTCRQVLDRMTATGSVIAGFNSFASIVKYLVLQGDVSARRVFPLFAVWPM